MGRAKKHGSGPVSTPQQYEVSGPAWPTVH